ncbi:hypothetical protein FAT61_18215, partial [Klebsiella pneumoniae subsp. pneumoniae]
PRLVGGGGYPPGGLGGGALGFNRGPPAGRPPAPPPWPRIRLRPRSSAAADRPAPDAHPLRYRCTA